jgi:predicted protein tyrosine phosphatase
MIMNEHNGHLIICGSDEIDLYRTHCVTHIIRVVNPGVPPSCPSWFTHDYLQLSFGDVVSEADARSYRTKAPHQADIKIAIDFCRTARLQDGSRILVSCDYGASRSPALAYVILADQMGPGRESAALEEILSIRPDAVPNIMVVAIGDELLGRDEELLSALKALFEKISASIEMLPI